MSELSVTPSDGRETPLTDPAELNVEALQTRVRELEEEEERRARSDAVAAVVSRYPYVTEEIAQALPEELSADRLAAVASAINRAMHTALNPPGHGRGGLTPSGEHRTPTWGGVFQAARKNL
ncbi:hypothetical protein [Streptomyces sp. CAU 1734]|uniref:hypothetical protein n=1 Tax=Streptomyces sp. CAU 1734 TaxID=3140360 RepID=UPI0032615F3A